MRTAICIATGLAVAGCAIIPPLEEDGVAMISFSG
jgi:hypothetical protein